MKCLEEAEAAEHFFTDELPPKDRGERKMIKVDKGTLEEQSELLDCKEGVQRFYRSRREIQWWIIWLNLHGRIQSWGTGAESIWKRKMIQRKKNKFRFRLGRRPQSGRGWRELGQSNVCLSTLPSYRIALVHNNSSSNTQSASSAVTTPTVSSETSPSPSTTSIPPISFISPPIPAPVCGKAPDFSPCVPMEKADAGDRWIDMHPKQQANCHSAFHSCCQNAALPAGCLSLCKYSTTHKEVRSMCTVKAIIHLQVKSAIDRGLCSVVAVPTFLKCASQGHDNSECCRHRAVHVKTWVACLSVWLAAFIHSFISICSGLQCEEFCRGSASPLLGLQHLICTSAVSDFLHCHLSGLRD